MNYANHILCGSRNDFRYLDDVLFSNECVFHTNRVVNKHNSRVWGHENTHNVVEVQQTAKKVMICCGVHKPKTVDPLLFSEQTIAVESYKRMLPYHAMPKVMDMSHYQIFQQDGAPSHKSVAVRGYLDTKLSQCWIGRKGPIAWPLRSPDLTTLDSFLWGYVKDSAFCKEITSLTHVEERINQAIAGITTETLAKVWKNLNPRINHVEKVNNGHIEQDIM